MVNIEIDGKKLEVPQGKMIIEVTDEIGVAVPRFCYHKKLSIAANCRMCLVEVENVGKPLPACATPVSEGMKIFTASHRAREAQKAVMEFLLINHPLDCPICDQGGQCELQDVALEYGQDYSRYTEGKRVVKDKNLGPLISTDMTRCIHCTRCVRFGSEIAGQREMGATGRGEFMEIGTYVEKTVTSEMSGNVIDLCPVGALTSKPFRFLARAWELQAQPSISPHDSVGSHLFFHTYQGKVIRTLPRENEGLNEVWLSDRDRFSYEGLNHPERLTQPWIKRNDAWEQTDWATALEVVNQKLQDLLQKSGPEQLGVLAGANCSQEEFYLLQKLFRAKGCHNIDHRLKALDTSHQAYVGSHPTLGITLSELETQEAILLIGSDIRKQQPIIAHRIRKATQHGAQVYAINSCGADFNFPVAQEVVGEQGDLLQPLLALMSSLSLDAPHLQIAVPSAIKEMAQGLTQKKCSILLGEYALNHPQAALIYAYARAIAKALGATFGEISHGANSAGGWLAGAIPHRLPQGKAQPEMALTAQEMLNRSLQGYFLLNCEPEFDAANSQQAYRALENAEMVVALTAYNSPALRHYADVLLPITPISEMKGTYVNGFGDWQTFYPAVLPLGESRPAWKVLRVLGNLLNLNDFGFESVDEVLAELQNIPSAAVDESINEMTLVAPKAITAQGKQLVRLAPTPLYAVDGIVRRSRPLQQTPDAQAVVKICAAQAQQLGLALGQQIKVKQDGAVSESMPIEISEHIPMGCAWVAAGLEQTQKLGAPYGLVELVP